MGRVTFIENYAREREPGNNSVLYALIRCLSIGDGLALLHRSYKEDLGLRDAVLHVLDDLEGDDAERKAEELAELIIQEFPNLPANRRASAFVCLGRLVSSVSEDEAHRIRSFMLESKYAAGRRKGLSMLKPNYINRYKAQVEQCAFQYKERIAVMLILDHFPSSYIYSHRTELAALLDAPWALARLYLRAATHDASCLAELMTKDGITYAYVLAKRGEKVSVSVANQLIDDYRLDERLGLLAWALGKMKLWESVVYIADHIVEWEWERVKQMAAKYNA